MIDSHCHLDFKAFNKNREEIILEAQHEGISTIINVGADMTTSRNSVKLANQYDMIYATVGIHPHDASTVDEGNLDELRKLSLQDKVVAIGEIGLDYYRDLSPRPVQKKAFEQQLALAVETKLPVVIHTRDAFEDTYDIIKEFAFDLPGGVFHCFPGNIEEAQRVIALGFVVSFGGVLTYKNSQMGKTATEVSLDKILLETDAPYLTPEPYRGKTNKPVYVNLVCDKLAELKNINRTEIEKITDQNCKRLFGLSEVFEG